MTNQEVLNKVWQYFVVEGHPQALEPTDGESAEVANCQYRTSDGNRCAIGCLITDELYVPEIEGMPASILFGDRKNIGKHLAGLGVKFPYKLTKLRARLNIDLEFAVDVQYAHDSLLDPLGQQDKAFSERMRARLTKLAELYNLEIPE